MRLPAPQGIPWQVYVSEISPKCICSVLLICIVGSAGNLGENRRVRVSRRALSSPRLPRTASSILRSSRLFLQTICIGSSGPRHTNCIHSLKNCFSNSAGWLPHYDRLSPSSFTAPLCLSLSKLNRTGGYHDPKDLVREHYSVLILFLFRTVCSPIFLCYT